MTPDDNPSGYITQNPKLKFFSKALGAIDGSHIHVSAPSSMLDSCHNQKGFISQNCLFCCSFDFGFTYALIRWEGSAADARIFSDAIQTDLNVPHGWYFLADAGFPHCKELLVPYQGVQFRNGEKLTCGNVKFLCHCHSKLILHVYVGQRINKNFLTCIMHKPAMLSSIFLVSSSTSSISF